MDKAFRLKVRVYNNRLIKAREELGLTQAEAARASGVSASDLSALETLKDKAFTERGWRPTAERLAAFYGYSPEYLWPDEIDSVRKNAFVLEMAGADVPQMMAPDEQMSRKELEVFAAKAKRLLTPRQARVVEALVEEERSLEEVGRGMDLSRTRVWQIRDKALAELGRVARKEGVA